MRILTLFLAILIAALQYPLWLGKGSWLRVWDLSRQIEQQQAANAKLKARNDSLDAEVRDLKQGYAAIEERARSELGMIKRDEVFYQVMDGGAASTPKPADAAISNSSPKP
jgi:cell division protein FtsB